MPSPGGWNPASKSGGVAHQQRDFKEVAEFGGRRFDADESAVITATRQTPNDFEAPSGS